MPDTYQLLRWLLVAFLVQLLLPSPAPQHRPQAPASPCPALPSPPVHWHIRVLCIHIHCEAPCLLSFWLTLLALQYSFIHGLFHIWESVSHLPFFCEACHLLLPLFEHLAVSSLRAEADSSHCWLCNTGDRPSTGRRGPIRGCGLVTDYHPQEGKGSTDPLFTVAEVRGLRHEGSTHRQAGRKPCECFMSSCPAPQSSLQCSLPGALLGP